MGSIKKANQPAKGETTIAIIFYFSSKENARHHAKNKRE